MPHGRGSSSPSPASPAASQLTSRTFTLASVSSAASAASLSAGPSSVSAGRTSNASTSTTLAKSFKATRRIHVSAELLKQCRIQAGEPLLLASLLGAKEIQQKASLTTSARSVTKADGSTADGSTKDIPCQVTIGFAWPSFTLDKDHISVGAAISEETHLETDDIVSLSPIPQEHILTASDVTLQYVAPRLTRHEASFVITPRSNTKGKTRSVDKIDVHEMLVEVIAEHLDLLEYFVVGQILEVKAANGITKWVKISAIKINNKVAARGVFTLGEGAHIHLPVVDKVEAGARREARIPRNATGSHGLPANYEAVGGLSKQIAQIRELVELPLTRPEIYAHFGLVPPRGLLLHGPPGTGKTLLASSIAASLRLPLFQVDGPSLSSPYHGETEQRLREIFEEAQEMAPSIVVIDEVDALVPAREDAGEVERRVVATLLTLMDGLSSKADESTAGSKTEASTKISGSDLPGDVVSHSRVIVIAATNRPNAIDAALRRPGRFDREIEIGVPDAEARWSILQVLLRRTPHGFSNAFLRDIASRTHGYVGADLQSLVHSAGLISIRRSMSSSMTDENNDDIQISKMAVSEEDMQAALLSTRPSGLRSVFLETPQVSWSDIGGQSTVKQKLQEVIEWPLKHPETFKRLGVKAPRGVLLYGPPGCSKTLIARALATSAGTNFIAIKGPEVFNKYVGESERTIRETFRKARAAAPCIVFLDEIDVLASSRDEHSGAGGSDRVLTTLLTEMDGIEELNGVTLLAATNRPDAIDSALMRPGRLDRILYVSPPDYDARLEIFKVNFRKMAINADVKVQDLAESTDGCSGAEIVSICQDAAFNAMNDNLEAENITMLHFTQAIRHMRKRITSDMIAFYEAWRDQAGVREA